MASLRLGPLSDKLVNPSLPIIPRSTEIKEIQESFADPYPSNPLYSLLGPQGSGKSTLLGELFDYYTQCPDRLMVDLSGHPTFFWLPHPS